MTYKAAVESTISLNTTSVTGANLNNTIFLCTGMFTDTTTRIVNFSSMSEVRSDDTIDSNSNMYRAALTAFSQSGCPTPFYIGQRTPDTVTFTATTVSNSAEYGFDLKVYEADDTSSYEEYTLSVDSDTDATATEIATLLYDDLAALVTAGANFTVVDDTGSVTLTPASGYEFIISDMTTNLTQSFTTTESASDLLGAVMDVGQEDWYFVTAEDHTEDFVLALADEIESTASEDYPKQYRVCTDDANSIVTLSDPAVDLLGKLAEEGYQRTAGEWNHEADDVFPEVAATCYNGQYDAGTTTWKFMTNLAVTNTACNPTTGEKLTTAEQGYIRDRSASWVGEERGTAFMHGGTMAGGTAYWIDTIQIVDYLNDAIETDLLNLLLNQAGGKLAFVSGDKDLICNTVNAVLKDAVDNKLLSGYIPCEAPDDVSFSDQAARILDDLEWTGYLAGAIHFIIVDGTLTYSEEELS